MPTNEWVFHPHPEAPPPGKAVLMLLKRGFYDVVMWDDKQWERYGQDVMGWWELPTPPRPVIGLRRV